MPFSVQDILLGFFLPALVAMLLTAAVARLAGSRSLPVLLPVAMLAGFLVAYWSLKLGPVVPRFDRQWIPYAVMLALVPSLLAGSSRWQIAVQVIVTCLAALLAAWLLMPDWEALEPHRLSCTGWWAAYQMLIAVALLLLARYDRKTQPEEASVDRHAMLFLAMMILALATSFILLAMSGSLRFAMIPVAGMAALLGVAIAHCIGMYWFSKHRPPTEGLALVFSFLIVSTLLTGYMNSFSNIVLPAYLLLPLVPLAHGLTPRATSAGPLTFRRMLDPASVAVVLCLIALGIAYHNEYM